MGPAGSERGEKGEVERAGARRWAGEGKKAGPTRSLGRGRKREKRKRRDGLAGLKRRGEKGRLFHF